MTRRKPITLDLAKEIESAMRPWKCPDCKKAFDPPLMTYISPRDGHERCESCAASHSR